MTDQELNPATPPPEAPSTESAPAGPVTLPWQGQPVEAPQRPVGKKPSITIGTPCRRGDISPEYVQSLANTLQDGTFDYQLALVEFTLIHTARNFIFQNCRSDYLLFIDSDIRWTPEDIGKLVASGRDLVGGLYFLKGYPFRPAGYITHDKLPDNIPPHPFRCVSLGAGFMMISRKAIETFKAAQGDVGLPFDPIHRGGPVVRHSGLLEEDFSFCHRAARLGFSLWCDPTLNLSHIGMAGLSTKEMLKAGFMGLPEVPGG